jgi:methionyl-tRNA formyltransferase
MLMAEGLDTGDMLLRGETEIGAEETASSLHDRLSEMGAQVLLDTVAAIENGTLQPQPQEDAASSYAVRITKEMSALDFDQPAAHLHNIIRGITGFTTLEGKRLKVYTAHVVPLPACDALPNGAVVDAQQFVVKCGDGMGLQLEEIQPEGKKRMKTADYLRGKKLEAGIILGQ